MDKDIKFVAFGGDPREDSSISLRRKQMPSQARPEKRGQRIRKAQEKDARLI
ncbi:MAG: hypothetical protein ABSA46_21705 [Thermodesulfovibrionales bacterium]